MLTVDEQLLLLKPDEFMFGSAEWTTFDVGFGSGERPFRNEKLDMKGCPQTFSVDQKCGIVLNGYDRRSSMLFDLQRIIIFHYEHTFCNIYIFFHCYHSFRNLACHHSSSSKFAYDGTIPVMCTKLFFYWSFRFEPNGEVYQDSS